MQKSKVAVVIPVHNGAKTLVRTLENLASQTFRGVTVIIAENASTDDSLELAEEFCALDPRFSVDVSTDLLPPVENFARAIQIGAARGEYFMLRAADDLSSPDYIEKLVGALDSQEHCLLAAGTTALFGGPKGERTKRPNANVFNFLSKYASGKIPRNLTFPAEWIYGLFRSPAADRLQRRWSALGTPWCSASYAVFDFVIHDEVAYIPDAYFRFLEGSGSIEIYGAKSQWEKLLRRMDYSLGCFALRRTMPAVPLLVTVRFFLMCWADSRRKTGYKILGFL